MKTAFLLFSLLFAVAGFYKFLVLGDFQGGAFSISMAALNLAYVAYRYK